MKKFILIILILSCNKIIRNMEFKNKNINENLALSIINEDDEKILKLIKEGVNINYIYNNRSILELTLDKKNLFILEKLLEKEVEISRDNVIRIYDLALYSSNYKIINIIKDKYKIEEGEIDKNKYFLFLCYTSNAKEVKEFIEKNKIDPRKVRDKLNRNGLIISALGNRLDIFKVLVEEYGFSINYKDNRGSTSLLAISYTNNKPFTEFILEKGVPINLKNNKGWTALILASDKGNLEVVKLLLEKGSNSNYANNEGWTALMLASSNNHIEVIKLLIEKRANINDKNVYEWTSLMLASQNGHLEIVKLLLKNGANVNDKEEEGWTALMLSAQNDHLEVVKLLIEEGSNINEKENNGLTALMIASSAGHLEVVKLLIEEGSNINEKENNGWAALILACQNGHLETAKLLLEKGSSIYGKDNFSKMVLDYISELLKSSGGKLKRGSLIEMSYIIIRKMAEDYIQLFISLNEQLGAGKKIKDEVHSYITLLYSLQNLPTELFEEIIKKI